MIPYGRQSISLADTYKVAKQLYFSSLTQGPEIKKFEDAFAKYVGSKYAVAVSSGTAALHISHLALNLPYKSEVLTSPISFVASSNAALYCGLVPRFIDINPLTLSMAEELLLSEINNNSNVSAIVPVHFAGYVDDISVISKKCKAKNIKIIEDAAHALGASYPSGEKVGSCIYSDLTVFSLHPVKSITAGEGGVITTNNAELYYKLLSLRSHGISQIQRNDEEPLLSKSSNQKNSWYYEMQNLGFHYRLTEIQAVLAKSQLNKLDSFVTKRRNLTNFYLQAFKNISTIEPVPKLPIEKSACHLFIIKINFVNLNLNRNELMINLKNLGIGSQVHYKPITLNPYYKKLGYDICEFPNAMEYYEKSLSIPLFVKLSKSKLLKIAKKLQNILIINS